MTRGAGNFLPRHAAVGKDATAPGGFNDRSMAPFSLRGRARRGRRRNRDHRLRFWSGSIPPRHGPSDGSGCVPRPGGRGLSRWRTPCLQPGPGAAGAGPPHRPSTEPRTRPQPAALPGLAPGQQPAPRSRAHVRPPPPGMVRVRHPDSEEADDVGGRYSQLLPSRSRLLELNWAPDGKSLVGVVRDGRASQVWRVGADGASGEVIGEGPSLSFPVVSPNGRVACIERYGGVQHLRLPCADPPVSGWKTRSRTARWHSPETGPRSTTRPNADGVLELWTRPVRGWSRAEAGQRGTGRVRARGDRRWRHRISQPTLPGCALGHPR